MTRHHLEHEIAASGPANLTRFPHKPTVVFDDWFSPWKSLRFASIVPSLDPVTFGKRFFRVFDASARSAAALCPVQTAPSAMTFGNRSVKIDPHWSPTLGGGAIV
jgi:hypothetical protein